MATEKTPKPAEAEHEVAQVNADLAAAHAEHAVAEAAVAERELAEATKDDPKARLCPHCNAEMTKHSDADPIKAGCWHCSSCGCCFKGREVREGHPICAAGAKG